MTMDIWQIDSATKILESKEVIAWQSGKCWSPLKGYKGRVALGAESDL